MALKVIGLGAVLLSLTAYQVRTWASDVRLWHAAAMVNRTSPRPAYNLGLAYRQSGQYDDAALWFMETVDRATGTPAEPDYRARVKTQFAVLESYGVFFCDSRFVQPYC